MTFNEKFIDKNIAELCKHYDCIKGANTNLARISPDLIDGLKPVQRRALYIMYLKEQGKTFRKVATIAGDVFGRVHPHSPVSIEDALVNIAQTWHNIIPLVEGEGNFGCHDDQTEVLTREGWKLFNEITKNDLLASVNPNNGDMIFEHPTNIFKYEYDGEMIVGKHHALDFKVTPNHNMLVRKYDSYESEFEFIPADQLTKYIGFIDKYIYANSDSKFTMMLKDAYVSINKDLTISNEHYKGYVYCAEVPTYHTLITKRNGKILLSGNSVAGDPAGASRYIKARLSNYAFACFFEDWKDAVVDMTMAYDEETKEPIYLPAKYPNVLLNGCLGIGYGMASNIPCFNFREVVEACITLMMDPNANIVLIPDSPTGADIIETDFSKLCQNGNGTYSMRCTYEIDDKDNQIIINSLPYQITVNSIREKIADIKERGGMSELIAMNDMSGKTVDLRLVIRDDVNPYKFMRKLIKEVAGLEKSYPVNITVTNDYESFDYSIKQLLLEWIRYRREQKRVVVSHKRTTLLAEQRTNDVKIFLMNKNNLNDTINIFRTSRNRAEIEKRLIEEYRNSEIRMDSLQAKVLSNLRMHELSIESYEQCLKRRDELVKEIEEIKKTLNEENGIDKIIIAELRDGIKRFGTPRRSNVIPYKISVHSEVEGSCIIQLSSDGIILRKETTNVYEEPIPTDTNGFAVRVENDASFVIIDDNGYHSYIKVKEIPIDIEVPINRFMKTNLNGNIIAMLPIDINSDLCCTLISKNGLLKKIRIADMGPSKKPCISLDKSDKLVRGLVTKANSVKDILVYTKNGMGQRVDPNTIRITSPTAKGGNGFKLTNDDEIVGCYTINPEENQYLLYMTTKGKARLNLINYLPTRDSKHDSMVRLISINDRDRLVSVIGCNKLDVAQVYFDDGSNENIDINKLEEGTMSSEPKKVTSKNAVTTNVVKVKLV